MLRFLDAYTIRARLFPAILGAAPALAALLLLISWKTLRAVERNRDARHARRGVRPFVWARKAGKDIYEEMGGKPSVTMMYRTDGEIDQASKDRYRKFLAEKVEQPEPMDAVEMNNPAAANAFYELAGTWLRENTRDTKKFPILFNEVVTYGFRRNLLGVKWPALGLNVVVVLICASLLWYRWPTDTSNGMTLRIIVVLVVAAVHALYFLLVVGADSVKTAARTYARQLILSCETFLAGGSGPRQRPAKKSKGKAS
jgi:hypothetical protein